MGAPLASGGFWGPSPPAHCPQGRSSGPGRALREPVLGPQVSPTSEEFRLPGWIGAASPGELRALCWGAWCVLLQVSVPGALCIVISVTVTLALRKPNRIVKCPLRTGKGCGPRRLRELEGSFRTRPSAQTPETLFQVQRWCVTWTKRVYVDTQVPPCCRADRAPRKQLLHEFPIISVRLPFSTFKIRLMPWGSQLQTAGSRDFGSKDMNTTARSTVFCVPRRLERGRWG